MSQDFGRVSTNQGFSEATRSQSTSEALRDSAEAVRSQAERQGAAGLDSLKEGARSLGEEAKERASRYVEGGKETVTGSLDTFAQAIRRASDELNESDQTMAAQLVRQAAGGLESLSRSIGGASIQDMVDSVRSFGRSNPVAFVGVSVLAGLALGRFARASAQRGSGDWDDSRSEWGSGGEGYGSGRPGPLNRSDEERFGFNQGFQPYSGPSYPPGERASFAPATHGGADMPPRGQGYAGGGTGADPIQSSGQSQGQSQGQTAGQSFRPSSGPSSDRDASVSAGSYSGGAAQPGSISTGEAS